VVSVGLILLFAIPAACGFARLSLPMPAVLGLAMLVPVMIPSEIIMVPLLVMFRLLGLLNTREGLISLEVATRVAFATVVLLHAGVKRGITIGYVHTLLPRFGAAEQRARSERPSIEVEPLSERELDVLRLLASDLDGPGIARGLTVLLSTMRTHTRSIFNNLGVNNRRAAVRRAEELRIIS
jgi:DNA-binding CsgD family transcriptional regulator